MIETTRTKEIAIFDIDGTLADVAQFRHHVVKTDPNFTGKRDFDKFHSESMGAKVIPFAEALLKKQIDNGVIVVLMTSRREKWRNKTVEWLNKNDIPCHALYMRGNDDRRPAREVKKEYTSELLTMGFDIRVAVDDDPSVIEMYESLDIPTVLIPGWI